MTPSGTFNSSEIIFDTIAPARLRESSTSIARICCLYLFSAIPTTTTYALAGALVPLGVYVIVATGDSFRPTFNFWGAPTLGNARWPRSTSFIRRARTCQLPIFIRERDLCRAQIMAFVRMLSSFVWVLQWMEIIRLRISKLRVE